MKHVVFAILILIANTTFAQSDYYKLNVGLEPSRGFAWAHDKEVNSIENTSMIGLSVEVNKLHLGNQSQQWCKNGYFKGFQFSYYHFSNSIIGNSISASYFLEPILFRANGITLSLRAVLGLAYSTNPFDSITNPLNKNYSLHINPFLNLGLNVRYKLNGGLSVKAGLNYNHISNGNIQDPNYGLNFPNVSLGLEKTINTYNTKPKLLDEKVNWRFDIAAFVSSKSSPLSLKDRFWVYGLGINASKRVNLLHAFTIGAEFMADESIGFLYQFESRKGRSYYRLGGTIGHEFLLGSKFIFSQQLGLYLFNQTPYISWVYHRWGLSYKLSKHVMMGANLLADLQKANFLDVRFIYSLPGK
jgi:hypothetical protein